MKKTIVVFSNPFGYCPTGIALPVLESFLNKLNLSLCIEKDNQVNENCNLFQLVND